MVEGKRTEKAAKVKSFSKHLWSYSWGSSTPGLNTSYRSHLLMLSPWQLLNSGGNIFKQQQQIRQGNHFWFSHTLKLNLLNMPAWSDIWKQLEGRKVWAENAGSIMFISLTFDMTSIDETCKELRRKERYRDWRLKCILNEKWQRGKQGRG